MLKWKLQSNRKNTDTVLNAFSGSHSPATGGYQPLPNILLENDATGNELLQTFMFTGLLWTFRQGLGLFFIYIFLHNFSFH